ncbi:hypothetical protein GCM10027347_11750 [Larkinella harenae]
MKTLLASLWVCLQLLATQVAVGQRSESGLPLRISLLNEAASLPSLSRLVSSLNPGVSVGTEFYYHQGEKHQWFQSLNLGGFSHRQLTTSLFVTSEVGYRFWAGKINLDLKVGPGYLLNKSAAPLYHYDGIEFVKRSGYQHRFAATAGLSIGIEAGPVTPFVSYNVLIEAPFLRDNSLFLPHQLIQVGIAKKIRRSHRP